MSNALMSVAVAALIASAALAAHPAGTGSGPPGPLLILPQIIEGVAVGAGAIALSLLMQMFLPLVVGMVLLSSARV